MSDTEKKLRIVVYMDGGVVGGVFADQQCEIVIIDRDLDGLDENIRTAKDVEGDEVWLRDWREVGENAPAVDEAFRLAAKLTEPEPEPKLPPVMQKSVMLTVRAMVEGRTAQIIEREIQDLIDTIQSADATVTATLIEPFNE